MHRAGMAALLAFGTLLLIVLVAGLLIMRGRSHRHDAHVVGPDEETLVDLGNVRCPNCGAAVTDGIVADWHHLRVHLTRGVCEAEFSEHPADLLDSSGIDWRPAERAAREINHLDGAARSEAMARAEAQWHLVRAEGR